MATIPPSEAGDLADKAGPEGRSGPRSPRSGDQSHRETLDYMRAMLFELGAIARNEKFDMLAYLLGMAHAEASDLLVRETARHRSRRD